MLSNDLTSYLAALGHREEYRASSPGTRGSHFEVGRRTAICMTVEVERHWRTLARLPHAGMQGACDGIGSMSGHMPYRKGGAT